MRKGENSRSSAIFQFGIELIHPYTESPFPHLALGDFNPELVP